MFHLVALRVVLERSQAAHSHFLRPMGMIKMKSTPYFETIAIFSSAEGLKLRHEGVDQRVAKQRSEVA